MSANEYQTLEQLRAIVGASSVPNLIRLVLGLAAADAGLDRPGDWNERHVTHAAAGAARWRRRAPDRQAPS